jgi:hypothetical protein
MLFFSMTRSCYIIFEGGFSMWAIGANIELENLMLQKKR